MSRPDANVDAAEVYLTVYLAARGKDRTAAQARAEAKAIRACIDLEYPEDEGST